MNSFAARDVFATVTNTSDDLTLIQRFIDGRASLESSPNLRIESDLGTTRLFTKKGVFLAAVKLAHILHQSQEADFATEQKDF